MEIKYGEFKNLVKKASKETGQFLPQTPHSSFVKSFRNFVPTSRKQMELEYAVYPLKLSYGMITQQTKFSKALAGKQKANEIRVRTSKGYMSNMGKWSGKTPNLVELFDKGTKPHNIPNAFGHGYAPNSVWCGTAGRFSGAFHPGYTKQKGFFERAVKQFTVRLALDIMLKYNVNVLVKEGKPIK